MNREFLARWGWRRYASSVALSRARSAGMHLVRVVLRPTEFPDAEELERRYSIRLEGATALQQLSDESRAEMDLSGEFLRRAVEAPFDAVTLHDRRGLAAYFWFSRHKVPAPETHEVDVIVDHDRYTYGFKAFVRKDLRGFGLGQRLLIGSNALLRAEGIEGVASYVNPDNFSARRHSSKAGGVPVGWAGFQHGPDRLRQFSSSGARAVGFQFVPANRP